MAQIVGHWESLAEAQKLVQSRLLAGVIQEVYEQGQLASALPVFQIDSESLKYNRQVAPGDAAFYDIGQPIPWGSQQTYEEVSVNLKRCIKQDPVDHFMQLTYKNPNDYVSQAISELRLSCSRTMENEFVYGPTTKGFDGLQALVDSDMQLSMSASLNTTGLALSLAKLDQLIDLIKGGANNRPDLLLMREEIYRRIGQSVRGTQILHRQEGDAVSNVATEIKSYNGIPMMKSDFLTQTEAIASGLYSAKTGGLTSTIFAIRFGQIPDGGLSMGFGGSVGMGELFEYIVFPHLEGYDAGGHRLKAYICLALGSTKALGALHGILDGAVTA